MRTHGWSGAPPDDNDSARRQIIVVTGQLLDGGEVELTMLQVARAVGISRQTLYRYFANIDSLMQSAAEYATEELLQNLTQYVTGLADPADAIVESIVFVLEQLGTQPRFSILFAHTDTSIYAAITSEAARVRAREVLLGLDVDWRGRGWTDDDLDDLSEHTLRLLQTFILAPGNAAGHPARLRSYLRRWLAPAITSREGAIPPSIRPGRL